MSNWPDGRSRPSSAGCWPSWRSPRSPPSRPKPKAGSSGSSAPCKTGSSSSCAWPARRRWPRPIGRWRSTCPALMSGSGCRRARRAVPTDRWRPACGRRPSSASSIGARSRPTTPFNSGEQRLQLLPGPTRRSWVRAQVEVHERLDGSLAVYYQGTLIATTAAPLEAPTLRARAGRLADRPASPLVPVPAARPGPHAQPAPATPTPATPRRPAADHPWRRAGRRQPGTTDAPPTQAQP